MPKLMIENFTHQESRIGIEPWADVETVAAGGRFEIEYDEPAEISFSLYSGGEAGVGIMSRRVVVLGAEGRRAYSFDPD